MIFLSLLSFCLVQATRVYYRFDVISASDHSSFGKELDYISYDGLNMTKFDGEYPVPPMYFDDNCVLRTDDGASFTFLVTSQLQLRTDNLDFDFAMTEDDFLAYKGKTTFVKIGSDFFVEDNGSMEGELVLFKALCTNCEGGGTSSAPPSSTLANTTITLTIDDPTVTLNSSIGVTVSATIDDPTFTLNTTEIPTSPTADLPSITSPIPTQSSELEPPVTVSQTLTETICTHETCTDVAPADGAVSPKPTTGLLLAAVWALLRT